MSLAKSGVHGELQGFGNEVDSAVASFRGSGFQPLRDFDQAKQLLDIVEVHSHFLSRLGHFASEFKHILEVGPFNGIEI